MIDIVHRSIRIDIHLVTSLQGADESATRVIHGELRVVVRRIRKEFRSSKRTGYVRRAQHDVTLPPTSRLRDSIGVAFNLEEKSLETLNHPTSIRVGIEVEHTSGRGVVVRTRNGTEVDGTDNLTVNLRKNFRRQDVSKLRLSIETVNRLQVLRDFDRVLSFQLSGYRSYGHLIDRECHLGDSVRSRIPTCLTVCGRHTRVIQIVRGVGNRRGVTSRQCARLGSAIRGEPGVRLVEQCFGPSLRRELRLHREDEARRTGHRLDAA